MFIVIEPSIDAIVPIQSVEGHPCIQFCDEERAVKDIFKIAIPFKHANPSDYFQAFVVYGGKPVSHGETCSIAICVSAELKGKVVDKYIRQKLICLRVGNGIGVKEGGRIHLAHYKLQPFIPYVRNGKLGPIPRLYQLKFRLIKFQVCIRAGKGRGQKGGNALPLAYIAPEIGISIKAGRYDKKQVCRVRGICLLSITLAITSNA